MIVLIWIFLSMLNEHGQYDSTINSEVLQDKSAFYEGYWVALDQWEKIERCELSNTDWYRSGKAFITSLSANGHPHLVNYNDNDDLVLSEEGWRVSMVSTRSYSFYIEQGDTLAILQLDGNTSGPYIYRKVKDHPQNIFHGASWPIFLSCLQDTFEVGRLGKEIGVVTFHADFSVQGIPGFDHYEFNLSNSLPVMYLISHANKTNQVFIFNSVPAGFLLYSPENNAAARQSERNIRAKDLIYVFNRK